MYTARCIGPHWQAMEKKYGIILCYEEYFDPLTGRQHKAYRIINNDGFYNVWDKGLSYKGLLNELRTNGDKLRKIAGLA